MIHHGLLLGEDGKKLSKRGDHASVGDLRDEGIPAAAVRSYLDELGLPRHDVSLDLSRIHRLAIDAIAEMPDADLAAAADAPLGLARALRGARTLVEARQIARQILTPEPVELGEDARLTLERFVELRGPTADVLDEPGAREIVRELKAVGGNLKFLRLALTGAERGPELSDRRRRCAAGRSASPCRRRYNTAMTVRLYDTATRSHVSLPDPPAKVGMYVCGPTVYQRAHIGNAVPFVIFAWLRNWLREQGYDVTYVHNITDVNDKIYEAAPGASAARAREATQWYIDDTAAFGLEMPDEQPLATETIPRSWHSSKSSSRQATHTRPGETSTSASRASRRTVRSRASDRIRLRTQEPSPLKEDARDFALWKARRPGETPPGSRRGAPAGRAGTSSARPWPEDARARVPGHPRWRSRPRLPASRERAWRSPRQSRRSRSPAYWMHNGLLRFTGEKMSKSVGNVATIQEVIAGWGREVALLFLMTGHWRKPLEFSDEAMTAASVQVESLRNALRGPTRSVGDWDELAAVLDEDFNTPAALAIFHRWAREGALTELRRGLTVFGLGELADAVEAPADVVALARARAGARAARDFAESDRLRDEIAGAGWEVRDATGAPEGFELVPLR